MIEYGTPEDARTSHLMLSESRWDFWTRWHLVAMRFWQIFQLERNRRSRRPRHRASSGKRPTSGDLKQKAEEAPPVSPEPATPNDKPAPAPATEPPATAAEVPARPPGATTKAGKPRKNKSPAETIAAVKEIIALVPEGRDLGVAIRENFARLGYPTHEALEQSYHRRHRRLRMELKAAERMSADNRAAPKTPADIRAATPKMSADTRSTAPKMSAPKKKIGPGQTNKS